MAVAHCTIVHLHTLLGACYIIAPSYECSTDLFEHSLKYLYFLAKYVTILVKTMKLQK